MKQKSLLITIIVGTIAFLMNSNGIFGPKGVIISGIIVAALSLILKQFAPTGTWVQGWSFAFGATNIGAVVIEILGMLTESTLFPLAVVAIIAKIAIVVNGVILAINAASQNPGVNLE